MYELENGAKRLASTLECYIDDPRIFRQLAQLLNYMPEQLRDDVRALNDKVYSSSED